jgi:hypothetical protein
LPRFEGVRGDGDEEDDDDDDDDDDCGDVKSTLIIGVPSARPVDRL